MSTPHQTYTSGFSRKVIYISLNSYMLDLIDLNVLTLFTHAAGEFHEQVKVWD